MLRNIFVFAIITIGVGYALQGPYYALLFYLWNAYFRPEEWVWGDIVGQLNLSFIIGIYLVTTTLFTLKSLKLNARTAIVLLFLVQALISTWGSEHWSASWASLVEFSKVILVSYLLVILLTDRRRFRLALLVIGLSLGFECAKQGWAQLVLNPGAQNNNTIAFLGDNNGVALGTMMLVPMLSALAQTATRRWESVLHRFLLFGVFMRGFTTYSRGGFLAAATLAVVGLARSQKKFRALISVAVVAMVVNSVMPPQFWDRMQTITAPTEEQDDSALGRIHFWQVAATMAQLKPLAGVGFNGFQRSYESYNRDNAFGSPRAVHSVWFGVAAEMGYPGLTLFIGALLMALWSCSRVRARAKREPAQRELAIYANALTTSLIVFAVGGTFLSAQYTEMYWHLVGLTTALHLISRSETSTATSEETAWKPAQETAYAPEPAMAGWR
jgi:probable O-glycosylation ligase (exosortase A-associated)